MCNGNTFSEALLRLSGAVGTVVRTHNCTFSVDFEAVVFKKNHFPPALPCWKQGWGSRFLNTSPYPWSPGFCLQAYSCCFFVAHNTQNGDLGTLVTVGRLITISSAERGTDVSKIWNNNNKKNHNSSKKLISTTPSERTNWQQTTQFSEREIN